MWRPQHYQNESQKKGIDSAIVTNALLIGSDIQSLNPNLEPIFTLRHLSKLTNVNYNFLRDVISRKVEDPYRTFKIRKSKSNPSIGFRLICVPDPRLLKVQRWIVDNILKHVPPHQASRAYSTKSRTIDMAIDHCGCSWLVKLDVKRFFESISEIVVYKIFRSLKYQPLISFELARICTRLGGLTIERLKEPWNRIQSKTYTIEKYKEKRIGHLPQGAPTSPMLSNLALRTFDGEVSDVALKYSLIYSRYADDLCFSTSDKSFSRKKAISLVNETNNLLKKYELKPNARKMKILPPGAKKIVLGLNVEGEKPGLSKEYKDNLRQHIYYLLHPNIGPVQHAKARKFDSINGLRFHLSGLISYAKMIDPVFGNKCIDKFKMINWPI